MRLAVVVAGGGTVRPPLPPGPRRGGYRRARARTVDNGEREPEPNTVAAAADNHHTGSVVMPFR